MKFMALVVVIPTVLSVLLRTVPAVHTDWYPYNATNWATKVGGKAEICRNGTAQSPIDFPACASFMTREAPNITWKTQAIDLINNGHSVQLNAKDPAPGGMSFRIAGATKAYTLVQCHFHWPSEHTVNGTQQVFEAHCVHRSVKGKRYGVFGMFYEVGNATNEFLGEFEDAFFPHALRTASRPAETSGVSFDLFGNPLDAVTHRPHRLGEPTVFGYQGPTNFTKLYQGVPLTSYWSYRGSFTTPPCTEVVDFYIFATRAVMTQAQLDKFQDAIGWKMAAGNFRPPQKLNTRTIHGCSTKPLMRNRQAVPAFARGRRQFLRAAARRSNRTRKLDQVTVQK